MTIDYTKVASYDVIHAMWIELQASGLFNINDYYADGFTDPLVPIFPSQQIPEMNNLLPGKPYITYDIQQRHTGVQFWMSQETIILEIISRKNGEVQAITNFLVDLFRRYDKTAIDINDELIAGSPFKFFFFKIDSADPVQPFSDEGGYMSGDLVVSYAYTRQIDGGTGRYV